MADAKPQLDPALVEKVARAISCETVGDYSTLYEDKREWTDDRGRRHDVNTPFKSDMRDAARAALLSLGIPAAALNALARGEAVVVSTEPTDAQEHIGGEVVGHPSVFMGGPSRQGRRTARQVYKAMIAASPYRSES